MKLKLEQKDSVSILEVTGEVTLQNFQVLKAGLTKLLREGKNKIILKCEDAPKLDSEVIREIAILDILARELSGKIVITSASEDLKQSVIQFSKPPMIPFLSSVDQAITYFQKKKPDEEEAGENVAELQKALAARENEIEALKAKIKLLDPQELKNLRAVKAELESKLSVMQRQVDEFMAKEREPMDLDGFLGKIEALEETVKKLSDHAVQKG